MYTVRRLVSSAAQRADLGCLLRRLKTFCRAACVADNHLNHLKQRLGRSWRLLGDVLHIGSEATLERVTATSMALGHPSTTPPQPPARITSAGLREGGDGATTRALEKMIASQRGGARVLQTVLY